MLNSTWSSTIKTLESQDVAHLTRGMGELVLPKVSVIQIDIIYKNACTCDVNDRLGTDLYRNAIQKI